LSRKAASTADILGLRLVQWAGKPQGGYLGVYTLTGLSDTACSIACSADEQYVVSGSAVKIWHATTGAEVSSFVALSYTETEPDVSFAEPPLAKVQRQIWQASQDLCSAGPFDHRRKNNTLRKMQARASRRGSAMKAFTGCVFGLPESRGYFVLQVVAKRVGWQVC
jgi:hypothetical protein